MAAGQGGINVKDITITSFGLVIAYMLPGLLGLYGLSFWFPTLRTTFSTFLTADSNIGLFLIVVMASLIVGLFAHGIRWIFFEVWCAGTARFDTALYAKLSGERKLEAFRTAVDEFYRYHQWWGGAAVVAPIGYLGWLVSSDASPFSLTYKTVLSLCFVALEALAIFAAWRLWVLSVQRIGWVLKGGNDMGGAPAPSPEPNPTPPQ
jgi:hypothetical protein